MTAVECTTFYLEMFARPQVSLEPPRTGLSVDHVVRPDYESYRAIYDAVGEDYNWRSRRKMTRDDLLAIIHHPLDEVHILHVDGNPAGFAELDRRHQAENGDIELVQFGLVSKYFGQGLGKWFLNSVVDRVWNYNPKRFWVHTCTLDHKAALPNYLKAGFSEYKQEFCMRELG